MADSERLLLFLAGGDPEQLLDDVRATRSPALLQYARSWLSLVAQDFRAELQSALTAARGADEGSRATKAQLWQATVIERVADAGAGVYSVAMKPPAARADGEGSEWACRRRRWSARRHRQPHVVREPRCQGVAGASILAHRLVPDKLLTGQQAAWMRELALEERLPNTQQATLTPH